MGQAVEVKRGEFQLTFNSKLSTWKQSSNLLPPLEGHLTNLLLSTPFSFLPCVADHIPVTFKLRVEVEDNVSGKSDSVLADCQGREQEMLTL